ncbi:MAG: GMC family oxidoreductase [Candidatus Aminicenantes bacterium]|nr:GMC family oxidoreductase [Candidatus Aminicenantes bacterium]
MKEKIKTQVLVIGSGAGGAITAAKLAEAGWQVLIVEEGGNVIKNSIPTHSPEAMRLWYRNNGLSPILGNVKIAFVEGRCVGGGTEINSAFWHRSMPQAIERWRENYAIRDLTIAGLNALYPEIEKELNVSFCNSEQSPRSSELLRKGLEALNWEFMEVPRAQNINGPGSPFVPGAKRSMSLTYIPRALQAGAGLLTNCRVVSIRHDGKKVNRVLAVARDDDGGRRKIEIEAENVFVCGGAIQTPALLRHSGIKRNVGNSLRIHPMIKVAALFDEQLDSHLSALPVYQVTHFWPDITIGGSVFTPGFLAMNLSENWEINQPQMREWHKMALYYVACCGTGKGIVRAFPFSGEAVGIYNLSKADQVHLSRGMAYIGEVLFAAGAKKIFPSLRQPAHIDSLGECRQYMQRNIPFADMSLSSVHVFSSCPMGENLQLCAADSFGRVHGFDNLYIGDASLIPDSPGVNPQGTVMALALRNANHFIANRKK